MTLSASSLFFLLKYLLPDQIKSCVPRLYCIGVSSISSIQSKYTKGVVCRAGVPQCVVYYYNFYYNEHNQIKKALLASAFS